MNVLDKVLNDYFTGYVALKDQVKQASSNVVVPSYVLEYLLGQFCATGDDSVGYDGAHPHVNALVVPCFRSRPVTRVMPSRKLHRVRSEERGSL